MDTPQEKAFFLENGYLHAQSVLAPEHLHHIRSAFERVWQAAGPTVSQVSQDTLLAEREFIELIEHPPILRRQRAIFGAQTQLLQYDLLRQGPHSEAPLRQWHRDFTFPGDRPLSVNTILYLDDMTDARGPTYVLPASHRGDALPPRDAIAAPLAGEVAVRARAGDAVFINAAVWHSGGRNQTDGLRRGIYLYYGYWWLKRYQADRPIPPQALDGASDARLKLLGIKMPDADLHTYDPTK